MGGRKIVFRSNVVYQSGNAQHETLQDYESWGITGSGQLERQPVIGILQRWSDNTSCVSAKATLLCRPRCDEIATPDKGRNTKDEMKANLFVGLHRSVASRELVEVKGVKAAAGDGLTWRMGGGCGLVGVE